MRRLRRAGAVVVGLTRVPELCVYGATDSSFGITRNPWNLDRTPGGSSGGAAASVAAGMVAAAHGNDGMGSIRIPAACCGLVGIKPGLGVVPADLGNGSWFDMAENGPLATTVADCALVLSVLAGRPELAEVGRPARHCGSRSRPATRSRASGSTSRGPMPRRRGWQRCARPGTPCARRTRPTASGSARAGIARWTSGTELDARALRDRSAMARRTRTHAAVGRLVLRAGYPKDKGRETWRRHAEAFFADHDVLVTPALAQSPIRSIAWAERGWLANVLSNVRYAPFAAPWNLAGWPAMAVPTGIGADGMPRAVQLVARPGSEATLLGLAAQLEQRRPWQRVAASYAPA